jgi:small subunit ribosomal protein S6
MALYESVVIARQDLSTAQVDALGDELTKIIQDGGGKVAKRESWGLRTLAYRIKKNRKGHYLFFNLDAPASAVQEYERRMRINEDVLRYLTVAVDALDDGPSAVLQNKDRGERDERGGGRFGGRGGRFGDRDRGDRDRGHFDSGRRAQAPAADAGAGA